MRATFGHLIDAAYFQARGLDKFSGASCRNHFKTQRDQVTRNACHQRLVVVTNADESGTASRQYFARAHLSFGKCFAECITHTHHFTGGLHLRAKNRVYTREFGEWEYRLLHTVEVRNDFFGEADFLQGLTCHDARSNHCQRNTDALGDERNGTRSARVHFNHIDIFALQRQLNVHQADNTQFQRHLLDLFAHLILDVQRQRIGRQRASGVTRVNTCLLNVLHDRADHYISTVAHCIDIHLDGTVEEVIEQHRAVVGHFHGVTQVTLELFFFVNDFHRTTAQHVGRTNHQRVTNLAGSTNGFIFTAYGCVWRLTQVQALNHLLEALAIFSAVDSIRTGANDRDASFFKGSCQFQWSLAAVLNNHAFWLLDPYDFQHVL